MTEPNSIVKILKDEYGISNIKELNTAIKNLGFVNISPFVHRQTTPKTRRTEYEEEKKEKKHTQKKRILDELHT